LLIVVGLSDGALFGAAIGFEDADLFGAVILEVVLFFGVVAVFRPGVCFDPARFAVERPRTM
jgi:hypothetical protein